MTSNVMPRGFRIGRAFNVGAASAALLAVLATAALWGASSDEPAQQSIRSGVSTGDGVRLRAAPDQSARVVLMIRHGDAIRIVEEDAEWYRVNVRGRVGYMARQYVRVKEHAQVSIEGPSVITRAKRLGAKSVHRLLDVTVAIFWRRATAILFGVAGMWLFFRRRRKTANQVTPQYGGFVLAFALTVAGVLSSVAVVTVMLDAGLNMSLQYALPAAGAMTAVAVVVVWRHWQLRQIAPSALKSTRQAVGHAVLTEPNRA